jgi:hypothetical protein
MAVPLPFFSQESPCDKSYPQCFYIKGVRFFKAGMRRHEGFRINARFILDGKLTPGIYVAVVIHISLVAFHML